MSEAQTKAKTTKTADKRDAAWSPELSPEPLTRETVKRRLRIVPVLITLGTVALAVPLGWAMWHAYMGAPWTRDGTVRVYVVTMAPEVAGRIVELPVADNQFVHKGDLLMLIDPRDYRIAVSRTEAAVKQAEANARNAEIKSQRRQKLTQLAVTIEEQQTYATTAVAAQAQYQQALANLDQAQSQFRAHSGPLSRQWLGDQPPGATR